MDQHFPGRIIFKFSKATFLKRACESQSISYMVYASYEYGGYARPNDPCNRDSFSLKANTGGEEHACGGSSHHYAPPTHTYGWFVATILMTA